MAEFGNFVAGYPTGKGGDQLTPLYNPTDGKLMGYRTASSSFIDAKLHPQSDLPPTLAENIQKASGVGPAGTGTGQTGTPGQPGTASAAGTASGGAPSYLTGSGTTATGGSNSTASGAASTMATGYSKLGLGPTINSPTTGQPTVSDQQAIQYYVSQGGNPNIDPNTARAYFAKANPNYGQSGVNAQDAINYYIQQGGNPQIDPTTAVSYYEKAHPQELQKGVANAALLPEQRANAQMAQIDPQSEALRNQVAGSYAQSLTQAAQGGPTATQLQSYLDTYKALDPQAYAQRAAMGKQVSDYVTQVTGNAPTSEADALAKYKQLDPAGYAQHVALGGSMSDWLKQTTDQLNLGSKLDPVTQRQVEQQTRAGQAARGNVYGTPQMVSEAMTTGQAGLALQAQRQAALQSATGGMQSYLGSGQTLGDIGNARYQQGVGNTGAALGLQQGYLQSGTSLGDTALNLYNQNQNQLRASQGAALGYLGSGQTPYQAGAGYLAGAEQTAGQAAQGGPQYNPIALGGNYTGTAQQAPQYGLDVGAQAQNYFNSLNAAYGGGGGAGKNKGAAALSGAASGALSGATAGAALGGPYAPLTAAAGAVIGGGLGAGAGYYS